MQRSGDPAGGSTVWLGWLFGAAAVALIFSMFSLAVAREGSFRGAGWPILGVFLATIIAWTAVIATYLGYVEDPQQPQLFGWPLPTGLTLFLLLPVMFLINVVFVIWFPRSILTKSDLKKVEELQQNTDSGDGA